MDYCDRVFTHLDNLEPGTTIDLTELKEPNRFVCAVTYLLSYYIDPINWQWNETWTYLRKLKG
jgi:hypothetical protein